MRGQNNQRFLIAALVCGAFGIGVSEFLVMGLLPEIAADLSPSRFAVNANATIAVTGGMVSGYAAGVVVGMVLTPVVLRRFSERVVVAICVAAMLLLTILTLVAPNLPTAIALRFLAALPHASYIGLASLMAARALGSRHHGRGAALVVGGLSISNVLGVPPLIAVGTEHGWRIALAVCILLFAVPLIALARIDPIASDATPGLGSGHPVSGAWRLVVAIVMVTSLASGAFAVSTFVAPISAHVQGPKQALSVAVLMFIFGVGMNLGNFTGGVLADRSARITLFVGGAIGLLGAGLLLGRGTSSILAPAGLLLVGCALGALTPSAQVVYVRLARRRPRLAASLAPGTINLGSFIGAVLGGFALAGAGAQAVVVVAIALYVLGMGMLLYKGATADPAVSGSAVTGGQ